MSSSDLTITTRLTSQEQTVVPEKPKENFLTGLFHSFVNLYDTEDLDGAELTLPLKLYNEFFSDKAENSSCFKSFLWRVTQLFLGVVAYPVLGLFAGIGMTINRCEVSRVKIVNDSVIREIKANKGYFNCIKSGASFTGNGEESNTLPVKNHCVFVFSGTQIRDMENVDEPLENIAKEVEKLTLEYKIARYNTKSTGRHDTFMYGIKVSYVHHKGEVGRDVFTGEELNAHQNQPVVEEIE